MEKNLTEKWIEKSIKKAGSLPKTWNETSAMMKEAYTPIDAMDITELETFAKDGKNKVFIAVYANCLLKARKTGKYTELNRHRRKIVMDILQGA